jgi:antitoxin (DNA-binding transcriptional repressor) of toxin-antitoxin stability system
MRTVGVRDLKDQLSQYLRLVKDGEVVLIKEHNRIIAEISLPKILEDINLQVNDYLKKTSEEGKIIRAKRQNTIVNNLPDNKANTNWESIYYESKEDRF